MTQEKSPLEKAIAGYPLFNFKDTDNISQKRLDAAFGLCPPIHQKTIIIVALLYARYEVGNPELLEKDWDFLKEQFLSINPQDMSEIKKKLAEAQEQWAGVNTDMTDFAMTYSGTTSGILDTSSFIISSTATTTDAVSYYFNYGSSTLSTMLIAPITQGLMVPTNSRYYTSAYLTSCYLEKTGVAALKEKVKQEFSDYVYHNQLFGPKEEDRRIFNRQVKLLGSVLDEKKIHCFLNGQVIELASERTGITYKFRLDEDKLKSISSFNKTHYHSTPYILDIFDADQVYLASLCVVIKDTPVLDQLTALILYIRSGEDELILKTANMHTVGDIDRLNALRRQLSLGALNKTPGKSSRALSLSPPRVSVPSISLTYKDKYRQLINQPKFLNLFK